MDTIIIPSHYKVKRSTPFFTKDTVPTALLTHHNTAKGIYGQICVMQGTLTFFGFADEASNEPEKEVVVKAGQFTVTAPQYWHRVALSDDCQFNINFWAEKSEDDSQKTNNKLINRSKVHNQPIDDLFDK